MEHVMYIHASALCLLITFETLNTENLLRSSWYQRCQACPKFDVVIDPCTEHLSGASPFSNQIGKTGHEWICFADCLEYVWLVKTIYLCILGNTSTVFLFAVDLLDGRPVEPPLSLSNIFSNSISQK